VALITTILLEVLFFEFPVLRSKFADVSMVIKLGE
jgi:hypothetical protein